MKLPDQVPIAVARERAKNTCRAVPPETPGLCGTVYRVYRIRPLRVRKQSDGCRLGVTANFLKVGVASHIDLTNELKEVRIIGASDRWAVGQLTAEHQPMRKVPVL